ncbi:MAG: fumarylacetoacetate hydrolase family protein [Alphaproteobacteria bacterium]|nr:fumarylacetoacetate hydrolase family protein [Alphaproteobacteria bacterium]
MKLVSFRHGGREGFGVLKGERVIDLTAAFFFETRYANLREVLAAGAVDELRSAAEGSEPDLGLSDIDLLLPIPSPGKIILVGQNYYADAEAKAAGARPDHPNIFGRNVDSFVPDGAALIKPKLSDQFDYEGELGVVIGRRGRHIAEADALDYVAGYTCINDGSVRDWQAMGSQNYPGKNFHHSGAIGPALVTADEIPDPAALEITTRVNGEVRQQGGTDLLVFPIPFLIAYVSQFAQLEPGDIISTGSPKLTAADMDPPAWLKPGDRLQVEISGIGTLRNPVEAE